MTGDPNSKAARVLQWLVLAGAVSFLLVYVGIAVLRIGYPFELEWMEGGLVDGVRRILEGQPLYVEPSVDFIPFAYPPLYHWLAAAVAKLTGIGYLPLRAVSFAASLGSFAVTYALVQRETRAWFPSVLAACLFAATFSVSAGYFDIARIDSLGMFLLLGGIYLARFATTRRGAALAGAVFFLSFMAKQIALTAAVPVVLYYALAPHRRAMALPFALTLAALTAGTSLAMDALHEGWFSYYVFEFHIGRGSDEEMFWTFLATDVASVGVAVGLGLVFVGLRMGNAETRPTALFYLLVAGALTAACALARSLALGAGPNVSIPFHAIAAVLFGLGVHAADEAVGSEGRRQPLRVALLLGCMTQFLMLVYNPARHVPSNEDVRAGNGLVDRIANIDGDVFVPCHAWLPAQARKRTWVHAVGIYDQLHHEHTRPLIRDSLLKALDEKRFGAVVLDYAWGKERWLQDAIEANYPSAMPLFAPEDPWFRPVTGVPTRPQTLYLREP